MQVTVLGSGTAKPTHRRACAGYLVEWGQDALLLEASAGTYMRALKAGLDPARLVAVVFSHLHPDHTADLAGLLSARRQEKATATLAIVGPPGTAELVERFRAVYGQALDTPVRVDAFPWRAPGLAIDAFPARHSAGAVCLRLAADGKVLGFSGDTGDGEGVRAACRDADLALLECTSREPGEGHLTPADCAAIVADARPRRVLLTHLGADVEPALPAAEDGLVVPL
jgi:ribonuclease BN (tRNA processing enzyme)